MCMFFGLLGLAIELFSTEINNYFLLTENENRSNYNNFSNYKL